MATWAMETSSESMILVQVRNTTVWNYDSGRKDGEERIVLKHDTEVELTSWMSNYGNIAEEDIGVNQSFSDSVG